MFIILRKDEWDGLAIVINHLGRPKLFKTEDEAYHYGKEFELQPFQIILVTIQEDAMTIYNPKSPYVKFARAYCDKMGLFVVNQISKKREYDEADILSAIFLMRDYENKNRMGNGCKRT